jgi:ArsR family transcriptional regulator
LNIDYTQVFATLGNETRLRCLHLVARNTEVCVCEVVEALNISQPAASKALNALKAAHLLTDRKDANWNYYALNGAMPEWLAAIVTATVDETANDSVFTADQKRFARLNLRAK